MKKDPIGIRRTRSCSSEAKSDSDEGGVESFYAHSISRKARERKYQRGVAMLVEFVCFIVLKQWFAGALPLITNQPLYQLS
jgi:hypothetical protein